jgi:acyl-CoA synthetase (AMP-forming)/AMP-acid ligase II
VGGDVLSPARVTKALKYLEHGTLVNGYRVTESTTFATCHRIRRGDDVFTAVPIGRPIANSQTYVLSEELELLPPGIAGELFIGGDSLARGYFNRPDLTAEKFIPNPFGASPGDRLYRTGDLVRYISDGELEFICPIHSQVRIRGFRVDLGKISSVLHEHPDVREVTVAVRGSGAAKRVVAYLVPEQHREVRSDDFKQFLQSRLPDFMVPSVVVVDKIPLKTSGKIDYDALPAVEEYQNDRSYAPPLTALEAELAALWQKVLAVPRVGREDNFFELGGNLLLATQLVSRIRERYHVSLPTREFMQAPTLMGLAEAVETAMWASEAQPSAERDLDTEEFIV